MTVHSLDVDQPVHRSFRLTRPGGASEPAVGSQVRPAIVLPDREARALLAAAARQDVRRGGCFSAGPAGVQVWSGPWNGLLGGHGDSAQLGSVDWSYDTPSKHYITVYRVMVTVQGHAAGEGAQSLLARVMGLSGAQAPSDALRMPVPPVRDPFRSDALRATICPD